MHITERQVRAKLKKVNLLNQNGGPLAYSQFKNVSTIMQYGKRKVVYSGNPTETLIGFYLNVDSDPNMLKDAYDLYKRIVLGDLGPIFEESVLIGNTGIPTSYQPIKWEN